MSIFGKKDDDAPTGITNEQLAESMQTMMQAMQNMPQMIVQGLAQTAQQTAQQRQQAAAKPAAPKQPTAEELDNMSRADLVKYMTQNMQAVMAPVAERIQQTETKARSDDRKQAFITFATHNPEFNHYVPELRSVLERNPELSPDDALKLAKMEAPEERHVEVAKAMGVYEEPKDESEGAEILSFMPRPTRKAENAGTMEADEAAEDAWDGVFGKTTELATG